MTTTATAAQRERGWWVVVNRKLQPFLVVTYSLAVCMGVSAVRFTPPSMSETIGSTGANTWGLLTLLGGGACLVGVLIPRGTRGDWFGEFVGIWSLIAVDAVYAGVIASTLEHQPGRLVGVFAMAMLAALLFVRWLRVRDDARKATRKATTPQPITHT